MNGKTIGPNPVTAHDIPITIRRRSLKYVLSAKELLDVVKPTPPPILRHLKIMKKIKNLKKLERFKKIEKKLKKI